MIIHIYIIIIYIIFESDITNYAYIWYKKDPTKLLEFTPEEQKIILKIILDYSYPCYLANDSISVMSKACLVDVMIIQIPRVLYDLFNFYYYNINNLNLRFFNNKVII